MHIVSSGDNLHEMSDPVFWKKKKKKKKKKKYITNFWSAELAQSVVKVKLNLLCKLLFFNP